MGASENMALYMSNRRSERRQDAVDLLGGCCAKCQVLDDGNHQFDHIDPASKTDNLANMWDLNWSVIYHELCKCQLLCIPCHLEKTLDDKNQVAAKETHGTLSSYRYCKCEECRAAKAAWTRDYRERVPRKS